jgi:NTE family protein
MSRALVLGGGGPVGIAWEAGVAAGLRAAGVDVAEADFIIGTSAGSVVGAQLALGRDPHDIVGRLRRSGDAKGAPKPLGARGATSEQMQKLMAAFTELFTSDAPAEERRAGIGRFALDAQTVPEDAFLDTFRYLAGAGWPKRFACTAVDALTGSFVVWDERSDADLVRAVASSCSVPGIFPPITIGGRRYIDGGMRSATNADLADGHDTVLIFSMLTGARATSMLASGFDEELGKLRANGASVEVVAPDEEAGEQIGPNLMDPAVAPAAAEAGVRQGGRAAERVRALWS